MNRQCKDIKAARSCVGTRSQRRCMQRPPCMQWKCSATCMQMRHQLKLLQTLCDQSLFSSSTAACTIARVPLLTLRSCVTQAVSLRPSLSMTTAAVAGAISRERGFFYARNCSTPRCARATMHTRSVRTRRRLHRMKQVLLLLESLVNICWWLAHWWAR